MFAVAEQRSTIPDAFKLAFEESHRSAKGRSFALRAAARTTIERVDNLREQLAADPKPVKPRPAKPPKRRRGARR